MADRASASLFAASRYADTAFSKSIHSSPPFSWKAAAMKCALSRGPSATPKRQPYSRARTTTGPDWEEQVPASESAPWIFRMPPQVRSQLHNSLKVCWLIVKTSNMTSRQLKKWLSRVSTMSRKRQLTARDTNTSAFFPSRYAGCWMVRKRSTYEHCSRSVIGLTIFWQTSSAVHPSNAWRPPCASMNSSTYDSVMPCSGNSVW